MNENNIFWRLYPKSKRENVSQKRVLVLEKIKKKSQKLPYKDNSFNLVLSISTIHNLEKKFIKQALNELIRVSKGSIFIRVKAFKNIRQKKFIDKWNLVAKSNLSEKQWIKLFKQVKFEGDYSFSKF